MPGHRLFAPAAWFAAERVGKVSAAEVEALISQRETAREEKDYAAADRLRDELTELDVVIEDSSDGTRWRFGND